MKAEVRQQRSLLELAELDAEIGRIEHRAKNLPEQRALGEAQVGHREAGDRLAALRIALADIDEQVAKFEGEIDSVRQRGDRDRALMDGGTIDPKQLTELQHELDTLHRRQTSLEDSLLDVLERREELAADHQRVLAEVDDLQTMLSDAREVCEQAGAQLAHRRAESLSRRADLTAGIDESLLALYERQRSRGGVGAGPLQGRRCGACRIEIDKGELARIAAAPEDEVLRCPECSAILLRVTGSHA
ncbi:MAG: zinc ribbon domain-containing protein [Mycolicibacterium sp.]|uniref:zinc ribbon domain-containing protein n=1 Tax=Mycolicibacterium sp. TaxID=2320850 RepID=UPI003D0EBCCA